MYEGKKEEVRPEYLNIAMNMAETIIELDPVLQNEIIHTIVNIIKENRHQLIDDAKKQLSYVKDSMQSLNEH